MLACLGSRHLAYLEIQLKDTGVPMDFQIPKTVKTSLPKSKIHKEKDGWLKSTSWLFFSGHTHLYTAPLDSALT